MKLEEFNYNLPKELIAQEPAEPRDSCRLMMVDKKTGEWEHHHFRDILDEIREGFRKLAACRARREEMKDYAD